MVLVLLFRPIGNLSLAYGMRHLSSIVSINPIPYIQAMGNPFVAAGIVLLILGLLVRMALLSVADLSYVLPLTASGYVISSVLAWLVLKEAVSTSQWVGTALIFAGSSFVSSTRADTTESARKGPNTRSAGSPVTNP